MSSIRSMPFPLVIQPPPIPGTLSKPPFRHQSQQSGPQKSFKRSYLSAIPNLQIVETRCLRALKAYNTNAINRFHQRKVHNTEVVELPQDDPPEPSVPEFGLSELPESDEAIPDYPIPFMNNQCHSSEL